MKIKSISKHVLAIVLSLAVLASTMMLNTFSVFATETETPTAPTPWTGGVAEAFDGGTGTAADPYQIATAEQFAYFGTLLFTGSGTSGKYFKLTNDIYLNDINSTAWQKLMADNEAGLTEEERATLNEWNEKTGRAEGATPEFNGHFDGDYHVIKGFYTNSYYKFMSIFGKMGWGFRGLKNLGIESSYISSTWDVFSDSGKNGTGYVAPFFSNTHNVLDGGITSKSIENCYAADSVILKGQLVGCFIGASEINPGSVTTDVEIKNCYTSAQSTSTATVWGGARHASFVAAYYYAAGFKFTNCYSTCNLPIFTGVDGGNYNKYNTADNNYRASTSCTNCYALQDNAKYPGFKKLTSGYMYGLKAEKSMSGLFGTDSPWVALFGNTPKLKDFGYEVLTMWDGETTYAPMTASDTNPGTAENPYLIYDAAEFAYLASLLPNMYNGTSGKYYQLETDIYLNDINSTAWKNLMAGTATDDEKATLNEWTYGKCPNGDGRKGLNGTLNGNGHTVHGAYTYGNVDGSTKYRASLLFGLGNGGHIINLEVADSYFYSEGNLAAALLGYVNGTGTIENCHIADTVIVKAPAATAGGLIAASDNNISSTHIVTVRNCYTEAQLEGKSVAALIADWYFGWALRVENFYATQDATLWASSNGSQHQKVFENHEDVNSIEDINAWFVNCYVRKGSSYYAPKGTDEAGNTTYAWQSVSALNVVSLDNMKGTKATTAMANLFTNGANSTDWFVMTGKTPELFCFSGRTEIAVGDVNVDDKVDLLDLVDFARAAANVEGVVINESNAVVTGTKFAGNTKAALKRNILGESFDEMVFPTAP